jgi:hypothetical protein
MGSKCASNQQDKRIDAKAPHKQGFCYLTSILVEDESAPDYAAYPEESGG